MKNGVISSDWPAGLMGTDIKFQVYGKDLNERPLSFGFYQLE
jgi:hypothetical protein